MKYPIGIQTFEQIINGSYTYVDKTDMIYSLVTEGKIYFLSRPRRFGKSLLISTLESYFLGRKELFKGLKIDAMEKEWNVYPVFHIDFNGLNFADAETLEATIETFVAQVEQKYGRDPLATTIGARFKSVLRNAHEQTGRCCVVLIDEYDKPMLDVMATGYTTERGGRRITLEEHNREQLKAFYSTFKAADADLQFVLLTGVTKFSQISVFSGFNQPKDISMAERYESLCGITDEEIDHYFTEPIAAMAEKNGYTFERMRKILKQHYDGYHFGPGAVGVYNPFSLLNAMDNLRVEDYWFRTGTPTYLVRLLEGADENINELTGRYYTQAQFDDYRATQQLPLPMIYQSGYLTIKGYRRSRNTYLLDFPNDEVKNGFLTIIANSYLNLRDTAASWVQDLLDALEDCRLDRFRTLLTSFLASIPYNVRRRSDERERERYFTYTLYFIFRIASCYVTYAEKEQSYGRLDCMVETDTDIFIFEFKLDGTAAGALQQINERGYATEYLSTGKHIHKIGASISSETGTLDDWGVED